VTPWLGFVELATLAALLFAAAVSLASAALWPWLRRRLAGKHPAAVARWLWLAAAAPSLAPPLAVALCLLPALLGADHCPQHGEHAHLCLHHLAAARGGAASALVGLAAGGLGLALLAGAARLARAHRAIARLAPGAPPTFAADVEVLATDAPLSLSLGAFRPRIVMSDGLVRALAPASLAVVLEHERAHVRRRDALRALLARALSWPHLPRLRRELLAALALATERACDEVAAQRSGDRLLVAETILAVERLMRRAPAVAPAALAASFGDSSVPPRIESLLAAPGAAVDGRRAWLYAGAAVATAIPLIEPLHHAVEHLLGVLLSLV
jgi:Zn-dependent protease with chaperone function